ncbi:MAG: redox-regulated ATPase YchF [Pyrodictiaceae archaeon]
MPPPERLIGVVGKANVGKSSFFAAATLAPVEIGDRPFVTLSPNTGVAYLRKKCVHVELGLRKCEPSTGACINGWRFIPVKLVDVPGLIPGAHQGRGLGNKFLDSLRQADALILVVDAAGATDSDGNPVPPGTFNPIDEVKSMLNEIDMWVYGILLKDWDRFARRVESQGENIVDALTRRLSGLSIRRRHVEEALKASGLEDKPLTKWSRNDILSFARGIRRAKPLIIAANKADLREAEKGIEKLRENFKNTYKVIPTSAIAELALRKAAAQGLIEYLPGDNDFRIREPSKLSPKQMRALEYIRRNVLERWGSTGVQEVLNKLVFEEMKMIVVYPVEDHNKFTDSRGRILPDAYLVEEGTTARELAYMIHTDLGKTFLYAINAKTKARIGEDYVLKDNDVIKIVATAARR